MGMFKGIENAKASFDAKYVGEGHYLCRIDRIKADQTRTKDDFLAVEMTVLHTFPDGDGASDKWHRPGEAVSHLMMAKHDSFMGNVKAMVSSILGVHESEVTENDCELLSSTSQPLAGSVIELKGRQIITRQNKPFTKITYMRTFPAVELQETLDAQILSTYFPGDTLEKMIEAELSQP